jgi:hypothetical protein
MRTRTMAVERPGGELDKVEVISEQDTEHGGGDYLNVRGGRLLKLSGEIWSGGPLYSGDALVEKVTIREGERHSRYSVARWIER